VLICPELPANVNAIVGYGRVKELITMGEQAAEDHIAEIKTLLQPHWYWPFSHKAIEIKKKNKQIFVSRTLEG
jgi:pyruvate/2-oxoacid:ferredoxin oxidoreductase alpha subunit